jgi:hypothetical protein
MSRRAWKDGNGRRASFDYTSMYRKNFGATSRRSLISRTREQGGEPLPRAGHLVGAIIDASLWRGALVRENIDSLLGASSVRADRPAPPAELASPMVCEGWPPRPPVTVDSRRGRLGCERGGVGASVRVARIRVVSGQSQNL